jgi:hypothetical protein
MSTKIFRAAVEPQREGRAMTAPGTGKLHCSSEWHLRHCPRVSAIYTVALRITKGGKNPFRVSNRNLAMYFGWHPETVREAMRALRQSGLFVLLRNGTGGEGRQNFASVYQVQTHSELAKSTRQQMCLNTLGRISGFPDWRGCLPDHPACRLHAVCIEWGGRIGRTYIR